MSDPHGALLRLCELHGVGTGYHDIWGKWVEAPEAALRALLGQLGVHVESAESIENALAQAHDSTVRRLIEPVALIDPEAASASVTISVPARLDGTMLRWRLTEEPGTLRSGECSVASLPRLDEREAGGEKFVSRLLDLGWRLSEGYHRLELELDGQPGAAATLVVAPVRCWLPRPLEGDGRLWGCSVQLYGLRSARNWGIGDLGDLLALADEAAVRGADLIGLNPMHARFSHNPAHCSPYSPSSRLALNTLYLDVEALEDFRESDAARRLVRARPFQARLEALRASELVDYVGVAQAKEEALRLAYRHFRDAHLSAGTERARAFRDFQRAGGRALRRVCLFEALQAHLHQADESIWGWQVWPPVYRDPDSPQVRRFESEHLPQVEYFEYLQWQTALQIERVAARCASTGHVGRSVSGPGGVGRPRGRRRLGLPRLLRARRERRRAARRLQSQRPGLGPAAAGSRRPSRVRLRAVHAPLRENMRHAGALRIDHVMGLMRLFWIPPGRRCARRRLRALPSRGAARHRGAREPSQPVHGDRRGPGHRGRRGAPGARASRRAVVPAAVFEREMPATSSRAPSIRAMRSPRSARTTCRRWPAGGPATTCASARAARPVPRRVLEAHSGRATRPAAALGAARACCLATGADPAARGRALSADVADAVHAYLARRRGGDDGPAGGRAGSAEQANMPGTIDEHPNWRRKLPISRHLRADGPRSRQPRAGGGSSARHGARGAAAARGAPRGRARPTGCSSTRTSLRRRGGASCPTSRAWA